LISQELTHVELSHVISGVAALSSDQNPGQVFVRAGHCVFTEVLNEQVDNVTVGVGQGERTPARRCSYWRRRQRSRPAEQPTQLREHIAPQECVKGQHLDADQGA